MIQPKNETEDLLLSMTKICETLIKQTHTKPEETLEFKMNKPRETFHFKPTIQTEGSWMLGLTNLEVLNSPKITKENYKFEVFTGHLEDEFSYTQLKDKVAEVLGLSDITHEELKHETFGPNITETYRKLSTKRSQTDGNYLLFRDYVQSPFRDFESYLRTLTGLVEEDIQLLLKQYNSKYKTYTIPSGAYTFKDLAVVFQEVLERGLR